MHNGHNTNLHKTGCITETKHHQPKEKAEAEDSKMTRDLHCLNIDLHLTCDHATRLYHKGSKEHNSRRKVDLH